MRRPIAWALGGMASAAEPSQRGKNRRRQFAAEKLEMACQRLGPGCASGNVEDRRYWIIPDTSMQYRHHRPDWEDEIGPALRPRVG